MLKRLAVLLIFALIAGCKPGDPAVAKLAAPAVLDKGWIAVSKPEFGFSVAIPPGWMTKEMRHEADNRAFGDLAKIVHTLGEQNDKRREADGYVLEAGCFSVNVEATESRPYFTVYRTELPDVENYKDAVEGFRKRVLEGLGFPRILGQEHVELPIGRAECLTVATQFGTEDETQQTYMVRDGKIEYNLTVITPTRYGAATKQVASSIAGTFRILRKPS